MTTSEQPNALAAYAQTLPPMDLVGPTVDDDIRRAVNRYGADAVKQATKRLTAGKKGRPRVKDWNELMPFIEEDAAIWIAGEDPFNRRSDYAIAKAVADQKPGQSHPATMKRIQRKLKSSIYGRKWFTLVTVWHKEESVPHATHLRTVRALNEIDPGSHWERELKRVEGVLSDYIAKHGEPSADITFAEVEVGARKPLNAFLGLERPTTGGLFGMSRMVNAFASSGTPNSGTDTSRG